MCFLVYCFINRKLKRYITLSEYNILPLNETLKGQLENLSHLSVVFLLKYNI